jgi:Derlin-2/3
MRYSRLLEENSFSNRQADYVWLLFLSASFLLVSTQIRVLGITLMGIVDLTFIGDTVPSFFTGICTGLYLVKAESKYQNVFIRSHHVGPWVFVIRKMLILRITAPYLPICMVAFSWLLQGGVKAAIGDIVCPALRPSV